MSVLNSMEFIVPRISASRSNPSSNSIIFSFLFSRKGSWSSIKATYMSGMPVLNNILPKCYCNFFSIPNVFVDCIVIQFRVIQLSSLYFRNRSVLLAPIAGNICPIKDDSSHVGIDIALQFVSIPPSSNTLVMTVI